MSESPSGIHIFTLAEANAALERVRELLSVLRAMRRHIVGMQAQVDIEELSAPSPSQRDRERIDALLREIEHDVHLFHKTTQELNAVGCELKDLEKGLVDFYGMRDNQVVYFCWQEGETSISHWHPLESGFQGRQKLED
jgi:hypothetical protein